ncbi:fused MFS/spermidine synthase [Desulfonatronum thioautotrophicum]|uniref:fused MFS/spermidine synthase n=1 Tax=Desulfonatronum thioautotrophicum TaxID=617001 RepID=UPI000A0240ED|nr:fused MFS/spermidine synthase [Desulfonatronum thioautotrophicum]
MPLLRAVPWHLASVLMLGLVSQLAQVLLLRELLMVFQGNELSIGIILSAWLAWTGLGSWLGGRLAQQQRRTGRLLLYSAAGLVPLLPATIGLIRNLRGFFDVLPGAALGLWEMVVSSFLVMAPVGLLLGAQFVLLARIWREHDGTRDASGASKTYMVEAAGNIMAGILFTFLLVHLLNAFQTATLAALLMAAVALPLGRMQINTTPDRAPLRRAPVVAILLAPLVLAVLAGLFLALDRLDKWTSLIQWGQFAPDHALVETRHSRHGMIAVLRRDDQYSFFQSGHLVFSTAGRETAVPGLEEQDAVTVAHLALTQHPEPRRVLLIGGGLRGMLTEILRHPVQELDYVELDHVLTATALNFAPARTLAALDHPGVRLLHTDARLFVKSGGTRNYDMIIVDAPDPTTAVLNRTYTREFFQQAQSRLAPGGVLAVGVASTPDLRGLAVTNRNAAIFHTLGNVFDQVLAVGERHLLFLATDAPDQVTRDPQVLRTRFDQREIQAEGFSSLHFHILLHEPTVRRINWILRHHGRNPLAHLEGPPAPPLSPPSIGEQLQAEESLPPVVQRFFINSDFRPIAYLYSLMFWDELTRVGTRDSLTWVLRIQPWWLLPVLLGPLLVVLALSRMHSRGHERPGVRTKGGLQNKRFPSFRNSPRFWSWLRSWCCSRFSSWPGPYSGISTAVHLAALTTGMSTMLMQVALLFAFQSLYGFIYETVGLIIAVFMSGLAVGTFLGHRHVRHRPGHGPGQTLGQTPGQTPGQTLAMVQFGIAAAAWIVGLLLPQTAMIASPLAVLALFFVLTFAAGLAGGVDFPLALACSTTLCGKPEQAAGRIYGIELAGACVGAAVAGVMIAPVLGIPACFLLAGALNAMAGLALLMAFAKGSPVGPASSPAVRHS